MKSWRIILFLSAFISGALLLFATSIRAATFTATLDHDTITLGETATLSLTFEGDSPKKVPVPPDVPGLQISYLGPSSQFSFINGQTKSTVTHNFTITAQRAGEFIIPPLTANVGGQQLTSPTLKLTVLEPNAPTPADLNSGSQIAFLTFTLPQQKFYVGQVVTGVLKIYLRNDVENANNLQLTGIPADGFTVGKLIQGHSEHTQIGNHIYTIIPFSVALTVIKAGTVSIGPVTAGGVLLVAAPGQQGDSFFEQFGIRDPFGNMGGARKQVSLTTDALTAKALPVPTQGAPASFSGAVGNYTMAVTAGPTNIAVGDPITVRVQISGSGNLAALTLPDQPSWHNFKTFQPTSKVDFTDQLGIQGTKTFEQIVTPQNTDVHDLPEFSFSFFNPDTESFQTLTQPAVQLAVHSGGSVVAPTIAEAKPSAEAPPPATILPIKQNLGALAQISPPLVTRPWFLVVQSLPVVAWLAAFVWRRRVDNLANNPRLQRQRRVAQLVQSGLDELRQFAAENNSDEFFSTLFHLMQEQLGERLDCPAFSITEEVVEEKLRPRGVPDSTLNALHELFQICNQARYAPIRDTRELNAIVAQVENAADELQNLKP